MAEGCSAPAPGDPDLVRALEVVKKDAFELRSLRKQWQDDARVVVEALKKEGQALQYASERLRADKAVVLEAVRQKGVALRYASKELQADETVVLEAVKQDGHALKHASDELKNSREVVWEAVNNNGRAFRFASKELLADKPIVLEAVKQHWDMIEIASKDLAADDDFMRTVVEANGLAISAASKALQGDREVMTAAIKTCPMAWRYASRKLQNDKDFLLLVARCLKEDDPVYDCSGERQAIVDRGLPSEVIASALAAKGETAPIVTAKLVHFSGKLDREEEESPRARGEPNFLCEVSLMSGASFSCSIPDCSCTDRSGSKRPGPILDDLASLIVEQLPNHTEMIDVKRVFINFANNNNNYDDGSDALLITPLDWERPLVDFLQQ